MKVLWKTKAAFQMPGSKSWTWITWTHQHGNKHAAIIEKANEIGADRWDFGNSDHGLVDRVSF